MSFVRRFLYRAPRLVPVLALVGLWAACAGQYPQTIFEPVTDFGEILNDLFAGIFWWTMLVLVVVETILVYVLIRYRQRPGVKPRKIYGNNLAEITWTLIPAIIVIMILIPTIRTIFYTYERGPEGSLVVEAIGNQWWWEFYYPELGIRTANQLHLPVGRPVEVQLSSNDVLHNWWVPRLGGKRYNYPIPATRPGEDGVMPSRSFNHILVFTIREEGEFAGQCAEFCGASHAIMRMRVIATEPSEFEAWTERMRGAAPTAAEQEADQPGTAPAPLALQPPTADTPDGRGYGVFLRSGCAACHAVAGTPFVSRIGPDLTAMGERWAIGAGLFENSPENMTRWIRNAPALKPAAKMPPFPQITDPDLADLVAYLASLR